MANHSHIWGIDSAELSVAAALATNQAPPDGNFQWVGDPDAGGNGDWNTALDWQQDSVPDVSASANLRHRR